MIILAKKLSFWLKMLSPEFCISFGKTYYFYYRIRAKSYKITKNDVESGIARDTRDTGDTFKVTIRSNCADYT